MLCTGFLLCRGGCHAVLSFCLLHTGVVRRKSCVLFLSVCRRYFAWKRHLIFICVLLLLTFIFFLSWSFCFFEKNAIRGNSSCRFLSPNDAKRWLSYSPWSFRCAVLGRQAANTYDDFYATQAVVRLEEFFSWWFRMQTTWKQTISLNVASRSTTWQW